MREPLQDSPRSLTEHLEELRRRLGFGLAAVLVGIGVSLTQVDWLMGLLLRPAPPRLARLAFFSPVEPLTAYLKVAALAGVILAMPVLLWQLWAFVQPGLTRRERRHGLLFIWSGSALFVGGVIFAYAVLLPLSLRVLLSVGAGRLEPMISVDRYVGFVTTLAFWCGVTFELPAVLLALTRIGLVTPEWLRQQRAYAVLVLVILAAILTPTTDVATLALVTVPLVVLYELSIWLARGFVRPRQAAEYPRPAERAQPAQDPPAHS